MMNTEELDRAKHVVDKNYEYFKSKLPELKMTHLKEFTLLYGQQIIAFYENEDEAIAVGMKQYGEGKFSVQQVEDRRLDLGYQSHVIL